jgi:hypothetical protein
MNKKKILIGGGGASVIAASIYFGFNFYKQKAFIEKN